MKNPFSFLNEFWKKHGVGAIVILIVLAYAINLFANYLSNKSSSGTEKFGDSPKKAYGNSNERPQQQPSGPTPAQEGSNEMYSSVNGVPTPSIGVPTSCSQQSIQNPAELLPKDTNSEWAQLNPSGKGELANINLLKAGYHIGIDTIGQTLRNANLQIRSEPPNPQLYVGPWNLSTIEPDFMRPPLEIGATNMQ
jgi:hypothetical protein